MHTYYKGVYIYFNMSDFGARVNYRHLYNSEEDTKNLTVKDKCNLVPDLASIFTFAFIIAMAFMMLQTVHLLKDMDELMKKTTANTYIMCELTKKIPFDNTTVCLN